MSMGIKEKILTTVYHFYTYLKGTYVTNLTSTSSDVPLAASQGKALNDAIANFPKNLYPIGTILMNTTGTNPGDYVSGTTWELWGSGKAPVGVNSSDTDFNSVEKSGGSNTHTMTIAELPAHTHSAASHTHSASGNHSHTLSAHTHTTAHTHSHTHTIPAHQPVTQAQHTDSSAWNNHTHTFGYAANQVKKSGTINRPATSSETSDQGYTTSSAGAHTHTVSTGSTTTAPYTTAIGSFNTGSAACTVCAGNAGKTVSSGSGNSSSVGGSTAFSIVQPYITCYMWKRTA